MDSRLQKSIPVIGRLFLILFVVAILTAVSSPSRQAAAAESYKITILGGSTGGLWAIITEGLAETLRRSWPEARITTEPGKDGPNQVMVSKKEVEFAVAMEGTTVAAIQGKEPYKGKLPNIRAVAVLNPSSTFQFIVDEKLGVKSIKDIKDQKKPIRVAVNRQGTLMDISSRKVFEAYGFSYADIEKWGGKVHMIPGPEAMDLWDAGQLDAIVEFSQYPSSRFIEHSKKHKLLMLPIDADKMQGLCKELGVTPDVMKAKSYPFQNEDCPTLNSNTILVTAADQPDALVTGVLKAMTANLDYLRKVHSNLQEISPQVMCKDLLIELHPAAAKFYKEAGVLK